VYVCVCMCMYVCDYVCTFDAIPCIVTENIYEYNGFDFRFI
jgi:hypothetical protein